MENSSIPTPITSVLVANRGEIARRVHHTARLLGMTTVAVFSDADAEAPHTREADAAVRLPGNTPAETYLRGDLVIAAAEAAGADAIHPGYGFLSENAGFARDVIDAGLTWVGPPVAAIEAMGSKIEAKKMMGEAGVPMLPVVAGEKKTRSQIMLYSLALVPVTLLPGFMGFAGALYTGATAVLGLGFLWLPVGFGLMALAAYVPSIAPSAVWTAAMASAWASWPWPPFSNMIERCR